MAKIEDCPGFETFGSDVKAAREALNISRRALAEQVSISFFPQRVGDFLGIFAAPTQEKHRIAVVRYDFGSVLVDGL